MSLSDRTTRAMEDFYRRYNVLPKSKTPEYRLKMRLTRIRRFLVHFKTERNCPLDVTFAKRLKAWSLGFTSIAYALYDLDNSSHRHYLQDFPDMNYRLLFPGAYTVGDKINFARNMETLGITTPEIMAILDRGVLLSADRHIRDNGGAHWLERLLDRHKDIVLKPCYGGAGQGICFVKKQDGAIFVNGVIAPIDDILDFLRSGRVYIATQFIRQADYAAKIYPLTTNTVRILTVWDIDKHRPLGRHQKASDKGSQPLQHVALYRVGSGDNRERMFIS